MTTTLDPHKVARDTHLGDPRLPARFWSKVEVDPSGCWIWQAFIGADGYGKFGLSHSMRRAHRVAYERLVGPVSSDKDLDHLCRNRSCVNPEHLDPVTRSENLLRGAQGYELRGYRCVNGHDVLAAGMRLRPRGANSVSRGCRECDREASRRRSAALRAASRALGITRRECVARYGTNLEILQRLTEAS